MKAGGTLAISVLMSACILTVTPANEAFSQVRPGIHTFVTPPEGCSYSEQVETENVYSFTRAQIQALSFARAGERASLRALAGGDALVDQLAKTIADLRQAQIEVTCAGFILSPYAGSKNESIATAAKYLSFAYEELGKMSNEMLGITMQASMQRKVGGSTRVQLSDLRDRRQEIMRNMTDALNVSLSLLVDRSHTDSEGKPDRLILTREQRISLRDYLHSQFPTLSDEKPAEPSDDFIKQAALIRSYLNLGTVTAIPK